MKIAAWLGNKDEAELLPHSIAHLRAIGVDHIYAVDVMSKDDSRAILAAEAGKGDLEMLELDINSGDPEAEHRAADEVMARARARGMDWLLFCDADEFPLPRTGRLQDMAELSDPACDAISMPRYNVVLGPGGPCMEFPLGPASYDRMIVHYAPPEGQRWRKMLQDDPDMPWIHVVPNPKLMVRLNRVEAVQAGHHALTGEKAGNKEDDGGRTLRARDLVVAHLPFSTLPRFATKIANIIELHEETGAPWPAGQAWHWRMFQDNAAASGIKAEFARNITDQQEMMRLQGAGGLRRVSDFFDDET